ncbi:GtrA family protein [Motilibacter sp. K478]|nr:GtrA family protein [Motilibacter aurantiacus]
MLRLYYGLGHLVHELLKFGVVGGLAFIVDIAVFNLLRIGFEMGPLTSKTIAVVVAGTVAYIGNRQWTFRHRARSQSQMHREYVLFLTLNGVGLAISLAFLVVSHYVLGFTSPLADNISANGLGLVCATTFRFWSYRKFVFPAMVDEAVELAEEEAEAVEGAPDDRRPTR